MCAIRDDRGAEPAKPGNDGQPADAVAASVAISYAAEPLFGALAIRRDSARHQEICKGKTKVSAPGRSARIPRSPGPPGASISDAAIKTRCSVMPRSGYVTHDPDQRALRRITSSRPRTLQAMFSGWNQRRQVRRGERRRGASAKSPRKRQMPKWASWSRFGAQSLPNPRPKSLVGRNR